MSLQPTPDPPRARGPEITGNASAPSREIANLTPFVYSEHPLLHATTVVRYAQTVLTQHTLIGKRELAYSGAVVTIYRALDDETRRIILDELAAHDGQTLFEICSLLTMQHGLGFTRQAISQHLGVLESAGLVVTQRRGRSKFHYFNPEPLSEITRRWPLETGKPCKSN